MVNIKDEGGELVFTVDHTNEITPTNCIIRVTPEASKVIDEIRAETGLSTKSVASALICFAGAHYSVTKE